MKQTVNKFTEQISTYTTDQPLKSDCGDLTVYNIGSSNAYINGLQIAPGDQYIVRANELEINRTVYTLSFDNSATNLVQVIKKIFLYD
jgi:hypothetical protein